MHSLARRRRGRPVTPAIVLAVLAAAALAALAVRTLRRTRRRARRRDLLAMPAVAPAAEPPAGPLPDEAAVEALRERPRPVAADEAARILGLSPEALAALNIPVTRGPDGHAVYDSWEIVHWLDVRRADPAAFEARTGSR